MSQYVQAYEGNYVATGDLPTFDPIYQAIPTVGMAAGAYYGYTMGKDAKKKILYAVAGAIAGRLLPIPVGAYVAYKTFKK